jgi:hypothetical protein
MTWEIVLGIIALVGFVGSIGVWVSKLSTTLATLSTTIELLVNTVKEFKSNSHETHNTLFKQIGEHSIQISDHETRIKILENKED